MKHEATPRLEPQVYTCSLPVLPPSLNVWKRQHWAQQESERKAFQEELWAAVNAQGNRCPRGLERIRVKAVLVFTVARRRDSDNFGAVLAKWTQDVLVQQRIIPDDTADRCTFLPPVLTVGESESTILVIEEVGDNET